MEGAVRTPRIVGRDHYRVALGTLLLIAVAAAMVLAAGRLIMTPAGPPSEVQLSDRDDGSSVRLALQGTAVIALVSNPSTGYAWAVSERSGAGLQLVGQPRYVPAGSTAPVVGAPGTEVLTVRAVEPGTHVLLLEYRRSFEPNAPAERTFRVTLEVVRP